jgi:hypothetical protein
MEEYELAPDLILVSGDIAFSATPAEYNLAHAFFDDILTVTKLPKNRLFVVPGNHDVNRRAISSGAKSIISSLDNRKAVNEALTDDLDRRVILRKFDNYANFVRDYFGVHIPFDDEHYFYVRSLDLVGKRIAVLGLNSAWLACSDDDRLHLALGERQVRQTLDASRDADLRITLFHHPFEWLRDFDRDDCEALLVNGCDFILRGHLHRIRLLSQKTPDAKAMIVAAGACYDNRQHRNGYNFIQLDLETRQGTVFLRAWSDWSGGFWTKDVQTYRNAKDGEFTFSLDTYLYVVSPDGDSLQAIRTQFLRHTERSLCQIYPLIPGITGSFPREEVARVEEQLQNGKPVILTGDAGTGKSGIGSKLARSAGEKGAAVLFLDARCVGHIQNEAQLRQHFDLNGSIHSAIERVGRYDGCRLIVDQLDNVAGSVSATVLVDLAIDCSKLEGVEVVVISRKREAHEAKLLEGLIGEAFVELTSYPLNEGKVRKALDQLGILQPSDDLVDLARNLLNLELIGKIIQEQSDFDFSALMDEVDLWEQYIQTLLERESSRESAEQIVEEAVKLAREGLNNEDRTFCLDIALPHPHQRLISWEIIVCEDGRVYRFRHEKLQDFLYAWDATQRHAMPTNVLNEINIHRSRNVFTWMDKIYSRSPHLHRRFLRETFNVQ